MTPFTILILVCSMAIDHAACQRDTAVDVVQGPKVANELQCATYAPQMTLAGTPLAPRPGLEYVKIVCNHNAAGKTAELD